MRFYLLQLLRFIAALLVLRFHLKLDPSGYKGVDIFFVISGFVMYLTLIHKPKPSVILFSVHRLTKIFFLYWLAILLLYFVLPYSINTATIKSLLLIPGHRPLLKVSWSLSYELYFYFIMALVVYLLPKKMQPPVYFLLLFAATIITLLNFTSFSVKRTALHFLLGPNFWEFLLGVGSGYLTLRLSSSINRLVLSFLLLFTTGFLFIFQFSYGHPFSYLVYGLLSFLMVVILVATEKRMPLPAPVSKLFQLLGDASYGIYLFGPVLTKLLLANGIQSKALIIGCVIVISLFISKLIETPVLQFSRSRLLQLLKFES